MNKLVIKLLLLIFAIAAVLYPIWVRFGSLTPENEIPFTFILFPFFGLMAFSLLWLHAISGVFEPWLRKQFNFDQYVRVTAFIIFISIILHPILLLIGMGSQFLNIFKGGIYIWLGIIGLLLLLTYDIGKWFIRHDFFARHWNKILIISTLGFLLTFFHSIKIGSDLQTDPLRKIWMFYGVTAIIATIYTYGFKRYATNPD